MQFDNIYCSGQIYDNRNKSTYDITIIGTLKEPILEDIIYYIAASPPDYRTTYTGSALPFANQSQAFDNTPNKGTVRVQGGQFKLDLMYPNSYMVGLGSVTVPPMVHLEYKLLSGQKRNVSIKISDGIPYRSLTYPTGGDGNCARRDATFYSVHHCLPIRNSQEQILRESGFPEKNQMPSNFWGKKPAL
jgi:hypothetical protein